MKDEVAVLKATGGDVQVLDSGCCGMAGPFGFEQKSYGVSQTLGERVLLPAVRAAEASTRDRDRRVQLPRADRAEHRQTRGAPGGSAGRTELTETAGVRDKGQARVAPCPRPLPLSREYTTPMDHSEVVDTAESHSPDQWLPVLLLLFVGSGCAALIYEIVWFQMLELFVGSSSVSIGVLLGTFMGGMCLGSFLLPRLISPAHHPLKVYALLEIVDRRDRLAAAARAAARRPRLHRVGRLRRDGLPAARACREHLPAAADAGDGRHASRRCPMGADDADRRVVARILLRRQHRRRGRWARCSRASTCCACTT